MLISVVLTNALAPHPHFSTDSSINKQFTTFIYINRKYVQPPQQRTETYSEAMLVAAVFLVTQILIVA